MAHIIICDDEELFRKIHRALLEGAEHKVTTAPDGADVLDLLAKGTLCDVIITDGQMEKIHGWNLLEVVQKTHPSIPVILVSALVNDLKQLERLKPMGFSAMLGKPCEPQILLDAVNQALNPQ